jgi:hypothetical protein
VPCAKLTHKEENIEEMDKFQDTYNYPKPNLEDISHLKGCIT